MSTRPGNTRQAEVIDMATVHKPDAARSERDLEQSLLRAQRQQIIGLLLIISAVVLFVAPWLAGCPDTAKDADRNELGVVGCPEQDR